MDIFVDVEEVLVWYFNKSHFRDLILIILYLCNHVIEEWVNGQKAVVHLFLSLEIAQRLILIGQIPWTGPGLWEWNPFVCTFPLFFTNINSQKQILTTFPSHKADIWASFHLRWIHKLVYDYYSQIFRSPYFRNRNGYGRAKGMTGIVHNRLYYQLQYPS